MRRWGPSLDWEHLQNWVPGVAGVAAVILLVVIAANSPTQTNSKPAELPSPQTAALATEGQTTPAPSLPAAPQTSSVMSKAAKIPAPPASPPVATTGEVAKPAPMHNHAIVEAEAAAAPPPVQGSSKQNNEPRNSVAATASLQGDTVAGRQVFKKCQACHSLAPGKTILGPSLAGIIGRKSGAEPDFNYSPALKQAALTWDAATLDGYLMDPQKIVPGNRMPFPGLKTDHDRSDVIAFLAAPVSPPVAPATANSPATNAATQKAAAPSASTAAPPPI